MDQEIPKPGQTIRTKKMSMEGVVEKVEKSRAGYLEVFFKVADGRLMKTPVSNVIIVQKLEDEDDEIFETIFNEVKLRWKNELGEAGLDKKTPGGAPVHKGTQSVEVYGWTVKYKEPINRGEPTEWAILSREGKIVQKGKSATPEQAIADAKNWINKGADSDAVLDRGAVIDFNVEFCQTFAEHGDPFYVAFIDGYMFFSNQPAAGLRKSNPRITGSVVFQSATVTNKEAKDSGLKPNGRYVLGDPEEVQPGVLMFPLNYHGMVRDSRDRLRLGEPGFTVGSERNPGVQ